MRSFSELDNGAFWPIVESTWTHYLEELTDPHEAVNTVVRLLKGKERSYITTPRSLESISWDQSIRENTERTRFAFPTIQDLVRNRPTDIRARISVQSRPVEE